MGAEAAPRRARLAARLVEREVDAALVTDLVNVRYLTGFTGSNGAVLVGADGSAWFATDGRYTDQAAAECPDLERLTDRDLPGALLQPERTGSWSRVAVETHALTVDAYEALTSLLDRQRLTAVSLERAVEVLRVVKDDVEIAALHQACEISVRALTDLVTGPLSGRTEREIARDLEWRMYALGAEAIAFDTIVASGPNSAIPHHSPTDRVLERGDLLKIDFGARVDGYHADCTRTFIAGPPADWQQDIHAAVRVAQQAGVDACVGGAPVAGPDHAARDSLDRAGLLEHFTTGLGHGVGLVIHEDPFVSARHPGTLAPRTPVTIEPGVYLPGRGGVRIEDTLVVGNGAPTVLTTMTKDLVEVG